jgi:hypothetical protein
LYGAISVKADLQYFHLSFDQLVTISPDLAFGGRRAQRRSRVAEGHREATCP